MIDPITILGIGIIENRDTTHSRVHTAFLRLDAPSSSTSSTILVIVIVTILVIVNDDDDVIALAHHLDLLHLLSREHLPVFHQLLTDNIIAYSILDSKDQL